MPVKIEAMGDVEEIVEAKQSSLTNSEQELEHLVDPVAESRGRRLANLELKI